MTATSVPDLLAHYAIRLKTCAAGRTEKTVCPTCHGGRTKELSLQVKIDADGMGATWNCKRGNCGWSGGERIRSEGGRTVPAPKEPPRPAVKPAPRVVTDTMRPKALYAWAGKRGISEETVDFFKLYVDRHWFPKPIDGERQAIVFPYYYKGEVVNRKYRPPEKNPQQAEKDALPTLFNVDSIGEPDIVWWVEGEPDVLAMHEAGYKQTVTLKDGAGKDLREEDDPRRQEDKRFAALATHAELLGKVKKFILAGDADKPGDVLREELARRLGRHRCWIVTWPDGCKDVGDVLQHHGVQAVRDAVEAALPYPIEGVQTLRPDTLLKLRHGKPPTTMGIGIPTIHKLHLPTEGRLCIVTGIPNNGKSAWMSWLMLATAEHDRRVWAVFSPEMQPWETYAAMLASTYMGKPFWPKVNGFGDPMGGSMTDTEISQATNWLTDRIKFLVSDAEDDPPTLDWIIERAKACVLRDGVTDLLIDPWNEIEHTRGNMNETEYVGRSLQRLKAFGLRHGCNVWIVAHPTKLQPAKPGDKIQVPGLYDVSGGANWANKADLAIAVHTPENITEIHLLKARFRRFGRRGDMFEVNFDESTGRYRDVYVSDEVPKELR
jgi:twinkle protein